MKDSIINSRDPWRIPLFTVGILGGFLYTQEGFLKDSFLNSRDPWMIHLYTVGILGGISLYAVGILGGIHLYTVGILGGFLYILWGSLEDSFIYSRDP